MTPAKGDPKKEKVGTEGAAPEAADDAAEDAKKTVAEEEAAEQAEEKPKPKRRRAAKPKAKAADEQAEADADADADAPEDDGDAGEDEKADKPKSRRRGAVETTTAQPKRRRGPVDPDLVVQARARYVRTAPRKARLVVDHIRGKSVDEARAILTHTPRAAAQDVLKVLNSAVANAEHNHELDADELVIKKAFVDEGPTLKRYQPRALGRATRILKRTSHLTIVVTPKQ